MIRVPLKTLVASALVAVSFVAATPFAGAATTELRVEGDFSSLAAR
jgi:hypothetical protein